MEHRTRVRQPSTLDGTESPELSTTARVLDIIRGSTAVTRSDIARIADLSRSAVVQHVNWLLAQKLVREVGVADSTGGRRARRVAFNPNAGCIAAVDLGAVGLHAAITNLAGVILAQTTRDADVRDGPQRCLTQASEAIRDVMAMAGVPLEQLKAIGIGVPGPVEFKTGRPVAPPIMPGWDGYPIRDFFAVDFPCPVFVDNDVNVMALGEQWSGLGRDVENFLFVKVGTGIGCGIVCQGRLYRGADGCAGDIGHIQVDGEEVVCRCGNVGCLETVAAAPALVRRAREVADRSPMLAEYFRQHDEVSAKVVSELAARGDRQCVEIIRESGRLIGHVLAGLVNFFNPSLIVVGGGVSNAGNVWLASIREEVYRRSLPLGSRNLIIQRSTLGNESGVIGVAALAIQCWFSQSGLSHELTDVPRTPGKAGLTNIAI